MRQQKLILSFLIAAILFSFFAQAQEKRLNVKVEPLYTKDYTFPEAQYVAARKNVGIAFSGGGSRSAAATMGELRALNILHLLDTVKYISAVSGGAWSALCYTYLPEWINDSVFLGSYTIADSIKWNDLTIAKRRSLAYNISHSRVFPHNLWHRLHFSGNETQAAVLNDLYLKPLKIGNRRKYFSYNDETVSEIIKRNIDLKSYNFYTVNKKSNRPFLIMNGSFMGGEGNARGLVTTNFEITPLYSGITYFNPESKLPVGGSYYETYGLGTNRINTVKRDNLAITKPKYKKQVFSLSDAMSITGNITPVKDGSYRYMNLWSPYQYWDNRYSFLRKTTKEFALADGGNVDDLGIIPLLKRKVDRIIVFVNSLQPITKDNRGVVLDDGITRVFGEFNNYTEIEPGQIAPYVLKNDKGQLDDLKDKLWEIKRRAQPLIYTARYDVQQNEKYGVYTTDKWKQVEITWVYNDNADSFVHRIKDKQFRLKYRQGKTNQTVKKKYRENKQVGTFPFYVTAWHRKFKGLDYSNEQVNLLADFTAWIIMENPEPFRRAVMGD